MKCADGVRRRVFVRVLGFCGDAPEQRLLAARVGRKDAVVDAYTGSSEHLRAYRGGAPRCVWVVVAGCPVPHVPVPVPVSDDAGAG